MKKEIRIGILGILSLFMLIFGYKFLKGQNLLDDTSTYYVKYDDVQKLAISDGVFINGYKVGSVIDIKIDKEDANYLIVQISIQGDLSLPKNTVAEITPDGVLGTKIIHLRFDKLCTSNCIETKSFIEGRNSSLLSTMLGEPEELGAYYEVIKSSIEGDAKLKESMSNIEATVSNLNGITEELNKLLSSSNQSLTNTFRNLDKITGELTKNKQSITNTLTNLEGFSADLKQSDIKGTMGNVNNTLSSANNTFGKLENTIQATNKSLSEVQNLLSDLNQGKGTLGKVMKDDALGLKIEEATTNLNLLLQDFRLNPKRYVNVSVFGKKQKEYTVPEDDPADRN